MTRARLSFQAGLLCALLGALVALWMWKPILDSWWYITDDYRWVTVLGPDRSLSFGEFLQNSNPSDWHLGSKVNRPTYYFTTSLFMYLFGDSIYGWSLARIGMMAASLAATGWLFSRLAGIIPALSALLLLAFHSLWFDALPRLQSELFAFFGLSLVALFAWGVFVYLEREGNRWLGRVLVLLTTLAGLYAAGAKENITVLMAMASGLVLAGSWLSPSKGLRALRLPALLTLVWSCVILGFIIKGLRADGADLYGKKIVFAEAVGYLQTGISEKPLLWSLSLFSVLLALVSLFLRSPFWTAARKPILWNAVLVTGLLGYNAFLVLFYRGDIPAFNSRYGFPHVLLPLLSLTVFAGCLSRAFSGLRFVSAALLAGCAVLTPVLAWKGVHQAHADLRFNANGAKLYTQATVRFRDRLGALVQQVHAEPDRPVLFCSYGFNDYEPMNSVRLFLIASGRDKPIHMQILGYSEESAKTPAEKHLYMLNRLSITNGPYVPTEKLPEGAKPILVNFSNEDLSNGAVANFWPLW